MAVLNASMIAAFCCVALANASGAPEPVRPPVLGSRRFGGSTAIAVPHLSRKGRSEEARPGAATAAAAASVQRLRGGGENFNFGSAPPFVLACAAFAAMDSLLLGYDIGCVSGILLFVQEEFGLTSHQAEVFASAMNAAALVGALVSGWFADKFGRKPALFVSSVTFAVGSIMMALANSFDALVYSRYIQGFGVGAGLLISPMFISEVAPKEFRGALVTLGEVSLSLGILLAYIINYLLSGVPNQWRWMIALGALPDVLLALRMLFLPESPRFLLQKGNLEKARKVQRFIMRPMPEAQADKELDEIVNEMDTEKEGSWREILEMPAFAAVIIAITLACFQHSVGIESMIYYSTKIFQQAGVTSKSVAILGTVGMGLVKLMAETYSLLHLDVVGRRPLLLLGAVGLTASLLCLGLAMQIKLSVGLPGITGGSYGVIASLIAYMAFHALSYGPISWLVATEILPQNIRGKAMGLATMVNRVTSFVVASTFLTLCEKLQWSGAFYVYAGFALLSLVFYVLLIPETNGLALEVITPMFSKPVQLMRQNLKTLKHGGRAPPGTYSSK